MRNRKRKWQLGESISTFICGCLCGDNRFHGHVQDKLPGRCNVKCLLCAPQEGHNNQIATTASQVLFIETVVYDACSENGNKSCLFVGDIFVLSFGHIHTVQRCTTIQDTGRGTSSCTVRFTYRTHSPPVATHHPMCRVCVSYLVERIHFELHVST